MVLHLVKEQELEFYLCHQVMSIIFLSYRLQWDIDYTNNVCEYEGLVLGLEAGRKLKIKHLIVYGDVELIVKQIKQQYQDKHLILSLYINCAWGLIENLF
jgi:hypothetical protein